MFNIFYTLIHVVVCLCFFCLLLFFQNPIYTFYIFAPPGNIFNYQSIHYDSNFKFNNKLHCRNLKTNFELNFVPRHIMPIQMFYNFILNYLTRSIKHIIKLLTCNTNQLLTCFPTTFDNHIFDNQCFAAQLN